MSTRTQLAALLANEQVLLSDEAVAQLQALAGTLSDKLAEEAPGSASFIAIGMDWSTLEIGPAYGLPDSQWIGGNQRYFEDASKYMRRNPDKQFIFGGTGKTGHWVKRIR
jgi:hypothetical protein